MEIIDLILLLWKRKGVILITSIGLAVVTFVICLLLPQYYEAKARVIVNDGEGSFSMSSTILASFGGSAVGSLTGDYVEIAKSTTLISETATELGLPSEPGTKEFNKLKDRVSVFPVPTANIMELRFEEKDPQKAMDFVNILVSKLQQKTADSQRKGTTNSLQIVQDEISRETEALRKAEAELERFKTETKIIAPEENARYFLAALTSLEGQEANLELALTEKQTRYASLASELDDQDPEVTVNKVVTKNPILSQLQQQLAATEMELGGLLQIYTEEHPEVIATERKIEQLKLELSKQAEAIVSTQTVAVNPIRQELLGQLVALRIEINSGETSLNALRSKIQEAEKTLGEFPAAERQLLELTRDKMASEAILAMLMQKEAEYRVQDQMEGSPIEILDPAFLPRRTSKPRRVLNSAAAGLLGLIISTCYVLFDHALVQHKSRNERSISEAV